MVWTTPTKRLRRDQDADEGVDQLLALSKQALRGKAEVAGPKTKKPKLEEKRRTFGGVLAARASEREEVHDRSRSRKKGPRSRKPKADELSAEERRKLKSKPLEADSSSDGGSDSVESSPDFRVASSREVDLVKLSKQNPGCLLRSALKEMNRYLAARGEAGREDPSQGRVLGYLHQILLPQYPKAGIRNQRELTTVATALDFMLEGELGRAGDLLAQRFKALEASLSAEGSWSVARHHELIPGQASLSTKAEQTEAAKAELRASKLKPRGDQQIGSGRRKKDPFRDAKAKAFDGLEKRSAEKRLSAPASGSDQRKDPGDPGSGEEEPYTRERPTGRHSRGEQETGSGYESDSASWLGEASEGSWASDESRLRCESETEGSAEDHVTRAAPDWSEVSEFPTMIWKLDLKNKTLSQLAITLVKLIGHCPGMLGPLAQRTLTAAASKQGTEAPWRDVLPLPVPDEIVDTVKSVLAVEEFKIKKKGLSGGAIKTAYRTTGIHCLTFCMITSLNALWSGLRKNARVHRGPVKAQQAAAVERLSDAAMYMIDSLDGVEKGPIPRTPDHDWEAKIGSARVSYHGEIVARAEALELDRVMASLPPEGFGGAVNILDLCEDEVRSALEDPASCILPQDQLPLDWPRPKVQVKDGEWEALAKALVERGMLRPTSEILTIDGKRITNGYFCG